MNSSLIGKIEKAKRYAQEPERVQVRKLEVTFRGSHDVHRVSFDQGRWQCSCNFFALSGICSHTMAMQRMLGVMLPTESEEKAAATSDSGR
ncbi:MAG: hypothetical protein M1401_12625 [Chloroflexi bacterium]|nr:hypothetical protein [Chloroflexota bacterium]MCL5109688.1 hypothetical protein [Chloroflexota bacterium]